jgi:hypothetical protein
MNADIGPRFFILTVYLDSERQRLSERKRSGVVLPTLAKCEEQIRNRTTAALHSPVADNGIPLSVWFPKSEFRASVQQLFTIA